MKSFHIIARLIFPKLKWREVSVLTQKGTGALTILITISCPDFALLSNPAAHIDQGRRATG